MVQLMPSPPHKCDIRMYCGKAKPLCSLFNKLNTRLIWLTMLPVHFNCLIWLMFHHPCAVHLLTLRCFRYDLFRLCTKIDPHEFYQLSGCQICPSTPVATMLIFQKPCYISCHSNNWYQNVKIGGQDRQLGRLGTWLSPISKQRPSY